MSNPILQCYAPSQNHIPISKYAEISKTNSGLEGKIHTCVWSNIPIRGQWITESANVAFRDSRESSANFESIVLELYWQIRRVEFEMDCSTKKKTLYISQRLFS